MRNVKWVAGLGLLVVVAVTVGCSNMMSCHMMGQSAASGPAVAVVNSHCPMMGNAINSSKVAPGLTREYNGQKIGFCCGGCPAAWDKLTPEQKDTKLKAAG